METITYTLDQLTTTSVSVKTQKFYNGIELGLPHRKAYMNDSRGRQELQEEVPEQYVNAIFAVWGDTPIDEPIEEIINENNSDTQADNEDENNDNQNTENETTHQE